MSLSSFLEHCPDAREYLLRTFPKPERARPTELLAPPRSENYSLIGTAFDYVLRWYHEATNPRAVVRHSWIADDAVRRISDPLVRDQASAVLVRAKRRLNVLSTSAHLTPAVLTSALEVARLDPVFRVGLGQEYIGCKERHADVLDLQTLVRILPADLLKRRRTCFLNPRFRASDLVLGADADLVLHDTLLDIKVTKDPKVARAYFNQLIGYYLLHRLGGLDGAQTQPIIRRIGIYFARYGTLVTWRLEEIASVSRFSRAAQWFRRRAIQHYGE